MGPIAAPRVSTLHDLGRITPRRGRMSSLAETFWGLIDGEGFKVVQMTFRNSCALGTTMTMRRGTFLLAMLFMLASSAGARAQGVQNGAIRGMVKDAQNLAVPGATVTATSPALQGSRVEVTDAQGGFTLQNLPPGDYQVKFELSGFSTITQSTSVLLGLTVEQNVTIRPAGVAETVNVVAETPAAIATPVVGANFTGKEIDQLANPRTIEGIAQLAPGLTENSPQVGQLVINGGFAFDNVFMINGVDI